MGPGGSSSASIAKLCAEPSSTATMSRSCTSPASEQPVSRSRRPNAGQSSSTGVTMAIFDKVFTSTPPTSRSPATVFAAVYFPIIVVSNQVKGDGQYRFRGCDDEFRTPLDDLCRPHRKHYDAGISDQLALL